MPSVLERPGTEEAACVLDKNRKIRAIKIPMNLYKAMEFYFLSKPIVYKVTEPVQQTWCPEVHPSPIALP